MEDKIQQSKYINKALVIVSVLLVIAFLMYAGKDMMISYKHPFYKFSIKYPSAWAKVENVEGAAAAFVSPKYSSVDSFQENVSVLVQDLSDNIMSLGKYTETAIFQVRIVFKEKIEVLESESGGTYLSGLPAYKFVYITREDPSLKIMHVWTISDNRAYQVTYTASAEQFDMYKDVYDNMLKSFQVP